MQVKKKMIRFFNIPSENVKTLMIFIESISKSHLRHGTSFGFFLNGGTIIQHDSSKPKSSSAYYCLTILWHITLIEVISGINKRLLILALKVIIMIGGLYVEFIICYLIFDLYNCLADVTSKKARK